MSQPNPEALQVPQTRADEIFRGKAAASIKDLMMEVAQLSAVVEQLHHNLQVEQAAHRETKAKLEQAMRVPSPPPGPPQDPA